MLATIDVHHLPIATQSSRAQRLDLHRSPNDLVRIVLVATLREFLLRSATSMSSSPSDSQLAVIVKSPTVHVSRLFDCEGMISPSGDMYDVSQMRDLGWSKSVILILLDPTATKLSLLSIAPGVNLAFGGQEQEVIVSSDDLSEYWER